jgi:ATP/maltotriose-dependent transcriptional regulator MalT
VLDRLEPGLQGFLLRCSVLELDAARCQALGEPQAGRLAARSSARRCSSPSWTWRR